MRDVARICARVGRFLRPQPWMGGDIMGREVCAMPIHDWTRVEAGIFQHFHLEWISATQRLLNAEILPNGYYALAEQITGGRAPDVLALERIAPPTQNDYGTESSDSGGSAGSVALATAVPRVRFTAEAPTEPYARRQRRISIRHVSDDRVVALVEIVSSGNKDRAPALRTFVEKAI